MTTTPDPIQPIGDGLNNNLTVFGENGHVAVGALQRAMTAIVRYKQHEGRILGHFWGGWDFVALSTGATTFRMPRLDMLDGGCAEFGTVMHTISTVGDLSTTAGIYLNGTRIGGTPDHKPAAVYPDYISQPRAMSAIRTPAIATNGTAECVWGFDSFYPFSGCFFEDSVTAISDVSTTVAITGFRAGADILGAQSGSYGTVDRLVDRFQHVWTNRRPVFTWFTQEDSYVEFGVSTQSYRYIFDQTVGTGGAAPSATGPAVTIPAPFAGAGLDTSVRVYVWTYAAMSGSTDGGTIAIANKDAGGTMGAMTALHNPPSIGGTGYAWYPSLGAFDASTSPYFNCPTGVDFDRVCLGGRSEGATDKLRIRAWMMAVYPSRA